MLTTARACAGSRHFSRGNARCRATAPSTRHLLEPLESRTLLSAAVAALAGYAPDSLVGRAATLNITAGSGSYPVTGSAIFAVASNSDEYYYLGVSSNLDASFGTYSYSRTGSNTATLLTWDKTWGLSATNTLAFTSASGGTFSLNGSAGTQRGTFTIVAAPSGESPYTITGNSISFQVADGDGFGLSDSGSFLVTTSPSSNTYTLAGYGNVESSTGTYAFTKTSAGTAHLDMSDSSGGYLQGELSFTTATSGSYLFGNTSNGSWQVGSFSIVASNAPPIGAVDLFTSSTISGWAQDPSTPTSPVTVAVYMDGTLFTSAPANIARADLLPILGSSQHAFTINLAGARPGSHTFQVYALDTAGGSSTLLASKSLQIVAPPPTGALDVATGTSVSGWCFDSDLPATAVTLHLYIDQKFVTSSTAGTSRPDLVPYIGSANHGFTFTFPTVATGLHRYDLYAYDTSAAAFNLLVSRTVNTNRLPTGCLDLVNATSLAGWAHDPDLGTGACPIFYQIDNNAPIQASASINRADLISYLGSPTHAFNIQMPRLTNTTHTLSLWSVDYVTAELVGIASRTFTGASTVRGWIDVLNNSTVAGWAYDSKLGGKPSSVRIDVDSTEGTAFTASATRPDLAPVLGATALGFSRPLVLNPGMHQIEVKVWDSAASTWLLLGSRFVSVPPSSGPRAVAGWIDSISPSSITGWAYSPSYSSRNIWVRISVDNIAVKVVRSDDTRPDLSSYLGGTDFGFSTEMPALAAGTHSVTVSIISPYTLTTTLIGRSSLVVPY